MRKEVSKTIGVGESRQTILYNARRRESGVQIIKRKGESLKFM